MDPVKNASLRMVAKSHKWGKQVLPTMVNSRKFYEETDQFMSIPNPDLEEMDILEYQMELEMLSLFTLKLCMDLG